MSTTVHPVILVILVLIGCVTQGQSEVDFSRPVLPLDYQGAIKGAIEDLLQTTSNPELERQESTDHKTLTTSTTKALGMSGYDRGQIAMLPLTLTQCLTHS